MLKPNAHFSVLKSLRFYGIGMLIYWVVQTLLLHRLELDWRTAIIDSAVSAFTLAFYCFITVNIFSYFKPRKGNRLYPFLFAITFAKLNTFCSGYVLAWYFQSNSSYSLFLEHSLPVRLVFSILLFSFLTAMYWFWNRLKDQREKEKRNEDMEQLAIEAELAGLRQKIQPHFLFNSLNSISALAISKPNEARKMIQQLSDFLRGTLKKDEQKLVPLKDELSHLNLYLEIEKVRFGHRLDIAIEAEENTHLKTIPPLLLQPIVENAIKFGLYDTLEATAIKIHAFMENDYLFIQVRNPFDIETQQANAGTGFGLSSVQRRLFLLYARTDLLIIEKNGTQFITTLKIPQQ